MDALRQLTYITNLEQKLEDLQQTNDDLAEELEMLYSMKVNSHQQAELTGLIEPYKPKSEYPMKLKTSLLHLVVKYTEKLTLKTRFAFDRWYDFAAEGDEVQTYQRMPAFMKEAFGPSKAVYQDPFGPHSGHAVGLFNVQGDRDGMFLESSSDDDKFDMIFSSEHPKRTQLKVIDQCTDLVSTVLKQCAVRMVKAS